MNHGCDLNIVVLVGTLATTPELQEFESGASLARLLLTVRSTEPRRRTDVIPVSHWGPAPWMADLARGDRLWVTGATQRRFERQGHGRHSRLEVVAHEVARAPDRDELEESWLDGG